MDTTREKLVLSAVLALTVACRLDKLIDTPPPPGLGVAPPRVAESADSGSGEVRAVALTVSSSPSRVIAWTAHREADAAWLVLTNASGSTPDTLRFTLDPGDRPPGTYRDAIIVVPDDSMAPSVRVPVELRIDRVAPGTGDVSVRVGTAGGTPDADGYTVTIDGGQPRAISINDSTIYTGVTVGNHTVQLGGLASNCSVSNGSASRAVTVPAGQTTPVTFAVDCPTPPAQTGAITVNTSTTGGTPDPDGYTVTIDGGQSRTIPISGSTTYTGLAVGSHTVQLDDVAPNCTVGGSASRTVAVSAGQTTSEAFSITCSTPPPTTGNLTVTTATAGGTPDPDGYTVTIDGGQNRSIPINGSSTYSGLAVGTYTVQLSGVAPNCTVSGGASRTVSVAGGQTTTEAFSVTCVTPPPQTGDLTVSTATTGSSLDPDGYTITVDGGSAQAIGINDNVTYPALAAGNHTVAITGVAGTCAVSGASSRTVNVPSGGTATTTFTITCTTPPPPTGDLTVTVSTTGGTPDPDGYTVTVDGGQSRGLGINETTTYAGLAAGSHSVQLNGLASNCTVSGSNPRSVNVPDGGTGSTTFSVTCADPPPPPNQAPTVNAGPDRTAVIAVLFSLGASFSDPDHGPWSYTIDWGDGSSSSGNASSPGTIGGTHTYVLPGSYRIRVTVSDSSGGTGSDEMILTVIL